MDNLEFIIRAGAIVLCAAGALNVLNHRKARKWLEIHEVDPLVYYEPKISQRKYSVFGAINYYGGILGRKIAYKIYSKKR